MFLEILIAFLLISCCRERERESFVNDQGVAEQWPFYLFVVRRFCFVLFLFYWAGVETLIGCVLTGPVVKL